MYLLYYVIRILKPDNKSEDDIIKLLNIVDSNDISKIKKILDKHFKPIVLGFHSVYIKKEKKENYDNDDNIYYYIFIENCKEIIKIMEELKNEWIAFTK